MDCRAAIRPVRTVKGEPEYAGRDVAVHWQYAPRPDETAPANLEGTHALWFLKKVSNDATYEAMWVNLYQRPMGGYLQPLPAGEWPETVAQKTSMRRCLSRRPGPAAGSLRYRARR